MNYALRYIELYNLNVLVLEKMNYAKSLKDVSTDKITRVNRKILSFCIII